jgi:alpha-1,2-mannosyltransferase
VLFVAVLFVYVPTIGHTLVSADIWSANFASWHLARTHSPWVDGIPMPPLDNNPIRHEWVVQVAGHTVIGRSPGVIAASLPAYALWHPASFSLIPGGVSAAVLSSISVLLIFLTLRDRLRQRDAWLAALTFAFATPVWSVAANGMWPHTVTVLGIAGMAYGAGSHRWWVVGIFGGITVWGRLHSAVIVAVVGLFVGLARRDLRVVVKVATPSLVSLAMMSIWTHWMYGTWNPTGSYDTASFVDYAKQSPLSVTNQLGLWISPGRGFLVWTPIVLLLLPALIRSWRQLPDWSRALVWGGLGYTVLQGALNRYSGGDYNYGYRLTLELLTCLTPALALSSPRMGNAARRLFGPVLALQTLAIATGAVKDGAFVGSDSAWRLNSFVLLLDRVGPYAWAAPVLAVGVGVVAARVWSNLGHDGGSSDRPLQGQT